MLASVISSLSRVKFLHRFHPGRDSAMRDTMKTMILFISSRSYTLKIDEENLLLIPTKLGYSIAFSTEQGEKIISELME
jgi:hypothetical protein